MKESYTQKQSYIDAKKKVKDILGFYTHLIATLFILPFLVFINLELVPKFHWFWFAIAAWILGLFIHWLGVFGFSKLSYRKDWKQKKLNELMNEGNSSNYSESNYIQEQFYIESKRRIKEVKGFYVFLIVCLFCIPLIIFVNLEFVPGFHFFWYAIGGLLLPLFFIWLGVFGFSKLGFGKDWEEKKIKVLMNKSNQAKF